MVLLSVFRMRWHLSRELIGLVGLLPRNGNVTDLRLASDTWLNQWQSFVGVDLVSLCLISRLIQPKIVFEIGTFEGVSALHFALNSPDNCTVYTLDLPRDKSPAP